MDNQVLHITLLFSVLIGVVIVFFFVSIVRYHRRYIKLQRERTNAEIKIQEAERKRIANDLHDSFGSILSAVKMNISNIETHSAADAELVAKSGRHIDDVIANLRRISYNLLPSTLERKGVVQALEDFVRNVQTPGSLRIELEAPPALAVPPEKGVHVFRVLQEIIQNTVKHAGARSLHIRLAAAGGFLVVTTRDDGRGFDADRAKGESTGLGLKSIESRVELLGGKLERESQPGKGTAYVLRIPV